ncbi:hypothetical protein INR49_004247 [Caranx melampygus]|nr:hypothetical protein INR49_004247 [Caranx melampygus]
MGPWTRCLYFIMSVKLVPKAQAGYGLALSSQEVLGLSLTTRNSQYEARRGDLWPRCQQRGSALVHWHHFGHWPTHFGRVADYVNGVNKVYLQVTSFFVIGIMSMMIPYAKSLAG